ncbi:MAG: DUF1097 domain-containing protein [Neptuniibacter sp.]
MNAITSTALSIAIYGGIATWMALSPLAGFTLIWAIFVAWAAFAALGGDNSAMKSTIICGLYGVFIGWATAIAFLNIPLAEVIGIAAWAGLIVGISAFVVVFSSHLALFGAVPATVLAYAATFAYLMQTDGMMSNNTLTAIDFSNPLLIISSSVVLGALFGKAAVVTAPIFMSHEAKQELATA